MFIFKNSAILSIYVQGKRIVYKSCHVMQVLGGVGNHLWLNSTILSIDQDHQCCFNINHIFYGLPHVVN